MSKQQFKMSSLDNPKNTTSKGPGEPPVKKPFTFEDKHRFANPVAADSFIDKVRGAGQDVTQALERRRTKIVKDSTAVANYKQLKKK